MTEKVKGIMFSVILIIIALLLLPIVINGVNDVIGTTSALSPYPGTEAIIGLIPLLVVVGIVIVAVINGLWAIKKG